MPILTPNTVPKNSAYRVCRFTFYTICMELSRAKLIVKQLPPETKKKFVQNRNESFQKSKTPSTIEESKENDTASQ
jgi:hypothetical protein